MTENQAKMGSEDHHLKPDHDIDSKHGDGGGGGGSKRNWGYGGMGGPSARRTCCFVLVIFLILAGITALTVWLVYRPHKPKFTLISVAIYDFNTSTPPFLSTTMQFTLVTRNPNDRVSIFYDHLSAYLSYKNQIITPPLKLPPLYHEQDTTVTMSPILGGAGVPVSEEVRNGLMMDESYGVIGLKLVLLGKLRWKAGAIATAHYGVYVKCDMLLGFKRGFVGQLPLLAAPACHVDV